MKQKPRRMYALRFACPACNAMAGQACRNPRGLPRRSVHRARLNPKGKPQFGELVLVESVKASPAGFYTSPEWRRLRYDALRRHGGLCQCCGSRGPLHVDHIKPRSRFPELELDINNLQVLCEDCNLGKGARDKTDWRGR